MSSKSFQKAVTGAIIDAEEKSAGQRLKAGYEARLAAEKAHAAKLRADQTAKEQARFVENMKPLTDFLLALKEANVLPKETFALEDKADSLRINTGLPIAIELRLDGYGRPRHKDMTLDMISKHFPFNGVRLSRSRKSIEKKYKNREKNRLGQIRYGESRKYDDEIKVFFPESIDDLLNALKSGYNNIEYVHFWGTEFKRGKTTIDDVNEFARMLIKELYDRYEGDEQKLKAIHAVVESELGIKADALSEITRSVAILSNQSVLGYTDEDLKMPEAVLPISLEDLKQRDRQSADEEFARAFDARDMVMLSHVGADLIATSEQISLALIE